MTQPTDSDKVRMEQREEWSLFAPSWGAPEFGVEVWAPRERVLRLAQIRPGQKVLDLACGTGNAAIVERVGPDGYMLGLDLTPAMVAVGQAWVRQHSLRNAEFRVIESELALPVPDASFDAATCTFGLMYMPDPVGALRAVYRALKPGGRAAVCTWASLPELGIAVQILSRHLDPSIIPMLTGPGPFALPTPEALEGVFTAAGFMAVETTTLELSSAYDSPAAFWDDLSTCSWPLTLLRPKLSEEVLQTIRDDTLKTVGAMFPSGPVQFTNTVVLAAGTKAS